MSKPLSLAVGERIYVRLGDGSAARFRCFRGVLHQTREFFDVRIEW
jgi:hypothetical protein